MSVPPPILQDYKCQSCGRLLFKGAVIRVSCRCPRCKHDNIFSLVKPRTDQNTAAPAGKTIRIS